MRRKLPMSVPHHTGRGTAPVPSHTPHHGHVAQHLTGTLRMRRGPAAPRRDVEQTRLYRLGRWSAGHPFAVMLVWLIVLAGAVVSARYFTGHLTGSNNEVRGSDAQRAATLVQARFPRMPRETDLVVLHAPGLTTQDDAFHRRVTAVINRYRGEHAVAGTADPYSAPQRLVSADRHTALVPVDLNGTDLQRQQDAKPLQDLARELSTEDIQVYFTGSSALAAAGVDQGAVDLSRAESIGLPAAAVVLLLAFGSLAAAAIPLLLGVLAVLASFGVLGFVSVFTPFDVFVQTAVSMVSIALGIDYSLFILTRYREELARLDGTTRAERAGAVGHTMATAGHAVLFSGTTVVVALAGLWLVRSPKVDSMALGMTAAVLVMMLLSVTLLPALLGLLGTGVNRLALPWARTSLARPDPEHSGWARLASAVMRRPLAFAATGTVLLGVLALPVAGLRYGVDLGAGAVADSPAGRGYTVLSDAFPPGVLTPISVVSQGTGPLTDEQLNALAGFTTRMRTDTAVADVVSVTAVLDGQLHGHAAVQLVQATVGGNGRLDGLLSRDRSTTLVTIRPRQAADSRQTADLVRRLRTDVRNMLAPAGLTTHVGGAPAQIVDISDESTRAMPVVVVAVLAASWLLLLLAFRSFLLPFTAILMNLLTSGAAFGAAVLVFQEGHGARLLDVDRTGFIQVILPLFAFALVFGLSMDYQVFMLSRMREEWEHTADNRRAVQLGITHTARVITAAASIMVVVFASFMFTRILEIKQMGFMLALAVLIDATVVRLLLVPAFMRILGAGNWWLPRTLHRLLPPPYHSRHQVHGF
jgi:putative drug exporter of the RND superfamily